MRRGKRGGRAVALGLLFGLVIAPVDAPIVVLVADTDADAGLPHLVHLEPGTPIGPTIPPGWTDRILRSVPRLASGAIASMQPSMRRFASVFQTVILAETARTATDGFVLRRVGLANAVEADGREVAVTPEGPAPVRESLGAVGRLIADVADSQMKKGRIVARSPTFALFRTPGKLKVDGRHVLVDLHYAILADPKTGAVRTLTWDCPAGTNRAPTTLTLLEPDARFDCAFDVGVATRVGPVAVAWSFAMNAPPGGVPVPIGPATASAIADVIAIGGDPAPIERAFRDAIRRALHH